jgi:anti-sigma-K factor RskA
MSDVDPNALAAEYVMGLLEGADRSEAERRLSSDSAFAREVERWRARFSAFDDTAEPAPAGDDLWRRIESGVPARAAATTRQPSAWARWWGNLAVLRATAAGASLAALVLAVGLGFAIREARQQPKLVAVLLDGDRAGAVVHAFADGRVVLVPLTTMPVPPGRALEVWTLPSKERGPVSVGLMQQARTLQLHLRPTGPILFKGNTAQTL